MLPVSDVIPPRTAPFITIALIVTNAITFAYQLGLDRQEAFHLARSFGAVPSDLTWPALLTSPFLHAGWIHLGANLFYLWLFGPNVEDSMGHVAFLCFYLAVGALGALVHATLHAASTAPLVGATGAVAGVMGAYFVQFPKSQVLTAVFVSRIDVVEVPAIVFLGAWFVIQFLGDWPSTGLPAADPTTSLGAHLAGLTAGLATGGVLRGRRRWH